MTLKEFWNKFDVLDIDYDDVIVRYYDSASKTHINLGNEQNIDWEDNYEYVNSYISNDCSFIIYIKKIK